MHITHQNQQSIVKMLFVNKAISGLICNFIIIVWVLNGLLSKENSGSQVQLLYEVSSNSYCSVKFTFGLIPLGKVGNLLFLQLWVHHHHHYVVLVARISLTLSHHFSLLFIASGRSSGLYRVSSHSCLVAECMSFGLNSTIIVILQRLNNLEVWYAIKQRIQTNLHKPSFLQTNPLCI